FGPGRAWGGSGGSAWLGQATLARQRGGGEGEGRVAPARAVRGSRRCAYGQLGGLVQAAARRWPLTPAILVSGTERGFGLGLAAAVAVEAAVLTGAATLFVVAGGGGRRRAAPPLPAPGGPRPGGGARGRGGRAPARRAVGP